MNCTNFFHIVDSCDVNRLSATERDACEEHAAACRHCAPHWVAFARLAAIPVLSMPPEVLMRCEAMAAIESRVASKRMAAGRVVVIGTIVALAAAAAMVAWSLKDESASPPAVASITPAAGEPAPVSQEVQAVEQYRPLPKEAARASDSQETLPAATPFNVLMLPPQDDIPDPAAKAAINAFQSALAEHLRTIPGLVLLSDPKQVEGMPSYFRITVQQLGKTLNGITYIELKSGEESPGKRWPAAFGGLWNGPGMSGLPIDTASTCAPAAEGQMSSCLEGVVSYVSSVLRKRLFPPNPARLLQLQNQALCFTGIAQAPRSSD